MTRGRRKVVLMLGDNDAVVVDDHLILQIRSAIADLETSERPDAVLEALAACHETGLETPAWVIDRLAAAAKNYIHARSRTLDDALGLARAEKGGKWKQPEAAFDAAFGAQCYWLVTRHMRGDNPTRTKYSKTDAFEAVAEEIGNGATSAKIKRNYERIAALISNK